MKQMGSLFFLFAFFPSVFADTMGHFHLGGNLGASIAALGNTHPNINYYNGWLTDAYPVDGSHSSTTIVAANGGYEFTGRGGIPAISLGLGIYGTPGNYDYNGQLIETALGSSSDTLYHYTFHISSVRLLLETQFTWNIKNFTPFINIGVGSAWNHLSDYSETPVNDTGYVALPPFESHTSNNFAYQLGFGIGYAFDCLASACGYQSERIALGYRYVDSGDVSFKTRGIEYPYSLDFEKLSSNEIYLAYTHFF
ncbi:MAG: outer membrane protein [Gammaproteobacteria bacterium]